MPGDNMEAIPMPTQETGNDVIAPAELEKLMGPDFKKLFEGGQVG